MRKVLISAFLFVLAFAALAYVRNWRFAALVMATLSIHEAGHIWMMRRAGIGVSSLLFIPLLGAVITPTSSPRSHRAIFDISVMGPLWGGAGAVACYLAYLASGHIVFAAAAIPMVALNFINLLPVPPLDGGGMLSALAGEKHRGTVVLFGAAGAAGAALVALTSGGTFWMFVAVVGGLHAWSDYRDLKRREYWLLALERLRSDPVLACMCSMGGTDEELSAALLQHQINMQALSNDDARRYLAAFLDGKPTPENLTDPDEVRRFLGSIPALNAASAIPESAKLHGQDARAVVTAILLDYSTCNEFMRAASDATREEMTNREHWLRSIATPALPLALLALGFLIAKTPGISKAFTAYF